MTFAWPEALLGLLAVAALGLLYVWLTRRRQRFTLRYSSTSLIRAAGQSAGRRRHIAPALYLLALAAMFVALARPTTTIWSPDSNATVMLVIDVSGSMRSADIAPTRIEAAQSAVRDFVKKQPKGVQFGLVAFSEVAYLVTPPTDDRKAVLQAVGSLTLGRGTNLGDGLRTGLLAILDPELSSTTLAPTSVVQPGRAFEAPDPETTVIVLLSDGAATTGPSPLSVAGEVAQAGIRVFTVGLGTRSGAGTGPLPIGPAPQFGGGRFMQLDEPTLRGIADKTGGEYLTAENAGQLRKVYAQLGSKAHIVRETTEVTFLVTGVALILLTLGTIGGLFWSSRLP